MKQLFNFLFSTKLTGLLFVIFAASMGIATFIENDYGTQTAKALIYNTWWFEMIMIIFTINFIGNIQKYKLYKKEKLATLVFHLAFALIILGAGITRYISFEGIMPIYEGETTDIMHSDRAYIKVHIDDGMDQKSPVFKDQLFANIPDEEKGFIAITSRFLNVISLFNGNIPLNQKLNYQVKDLICVKSCPLNESQYLIIYFLLL